MQMTSSLSLMPSAHEKIASDSQEVALIVDDEATNRLVLSALLKQQDFHVIEAEDGEQAVKLFNQSKPDIIFMDIMMPGIDGYEAISRIKKQCNDKFIPIIVLTALNDEDTLTKCIAVGGDDVLCKPFDAAILKSKIYAMLRIRDLHKHVSNLYTKMKREESIAEVIFSRAVTALNIKPEGLNILSRPASTFSGDMVLSAYSPGGDLHVLLGDFTGHGLSAAIGALPTAEVFRTMVTKGFNSDSIISAINSKLYSMLPADIFMAASYLQIANDQSHIMVYNCGVPDILIFNKSVSRINHKISSAFFPLGINAIFPSHDVSQRLELKNGDKLYMYSDGVIENRNIQNEEFGQLRLENLINNHGKESNSYADIITDIENFSNHERQHDDITLLELEFNPGLINKEQIEASPISPKSKGSDTKNITKTSDSFRFSIMLSGKRLRDNDLLPLLMNELHEMELPKHALSSTYTIIAELISNALDHGVLGLDSSIKSRPNGFSDYLDEREKRLDSIENASISVEMLGYNTQNGGRLEIIIEDSGAGFSFSPEDSCNEGNMNHFGRGISLIKSLCETFHYEEPGNIAKAVYSWTDNL